MITFERTVRAGSGKASAPAVARPDDAAVIRLEFAGTRQPANRYSVHCQLDERCAFVRGPGWWLYVSTPVGLACFTTLNQMLAQAPSLALTALLELLENLRPVAFVAFDETTETIHFGRSLDGFCSLYFGATPAPLVIADSRTVVAQRLGSVRFSRRDQEAWCVRRVLPPEGSFYEGVKRCFAGTRYQLGADEHEPCHRRLMASDARISEHPDPVSQLTEGLRATFSGYGNRKVALRLSGGVDSRVLLVGLMDAVREGILRRDQVLCTSVLFPGFDCDESDVIRPVVELSGFDWVGIEATRENVRQAWEDCLALPAPPFPTSFMGALCMQAAQRRGAQIMLGGHGGDELFDFNLPDVLGIGLGARLQRLDLIRYLRQTRTWRDEARALAVALLGRRSQRSLRRSLREYGLPRADLNAFRLETRLGLAQGCGYETTAIAAAEHGLLTDVPFFRGPFLAQIDPVGKTRSRDFHYKANAHRYMAAHAPGIAAVPTRKVAFDAAIAQLFRPESPDCDTVDSAPSGAYATALGYTEWRKFRHSTGDKGHGYNYQHKHSYRPGSTK